MTFEQAVTLFEIAVAELKDQGVIGLRDLSDGKVELHIASKEIFEAMPGEAILKSITEDYDHFYKTVGNIDYVCLYQKQNTE
ncbi:MAG: hypothetical protein ABFD79_18760 [Phycisphaerales bacterium]